MYTVILIILIYCSLCLGTGACAIYPLLAATKNKWCMIGTESDDLSLQEALENVQRNNLQELIQCMYSVL